MVIDDKVDLFTSQFYDSQRTAAIKQKFLMKIKYHIY